jgi:ribosomal protein S18 acetylase RimI-like enzyme
VLKIWKETMIIEPATVADAAGILALQKLAYLSEAELYNDFTIPPLTQTLDEITAEFGRRIFLKAAERGTIIGSVQGFQVGGTCHVGRLMVLPERQGERIGTRLMAAIEAVFADVERFELFTGHKSLLNIRLYERLGYRVFRTEAVTPALSLVFMEKLVT